MAVALTAFKVAGPVLGGLAANAQGMNESARLESEARLAETQALQRDTAARDELSRFLSTIRASRAANGLSANSPNALILEKEARETSDQDRLRQRANDRQRAANFRAAAKSARQGARFSLLTGVAKGGVALGQFAGGF